MARGKDITGQRSQELMRKRIDQRITKAGLAFTLAVVLTGVAAFLSANNLIFLITSARCGGDGGMPGFGSR